MANRRTAPPEPEATGSAAPDGAALWQRIRQALADDLDAARYPPGARLPTEAELARRFGVNRHTVRRALRALIEEGRIHVRRGSGAFVTQKRMDYAIGARTRFSRNIATLGHAPDRVLLRCEEVPAGPAEATHLGVNPGDPVVLTESVSTSDGVPVVYARSFYPASRLPGIADGLRAQRSITEALRRVGVDDYQRLWTRLAAESPGPLIARHLQMPESHPVLRAESLNIGPDGQPVEFGLSWFCSDRITLVVDRGSFT